MIIPTGELRLRDQAYTGEEPPSILELDGDPMVRAREPVRYALSARRLEGDLLVRGSLEAPLEFLCARCAQWFRKTLRVPDFVRSIPLSSENESIDLTPDIREDILLALPINQVCSDHCRGLCPVCGANRNRTACSCRADEGRSTWSVLDRLKIE